MPHDKSFRFKYFLGHLVISTLAVSILLVLVVSQWFPDFLFWTEGAYFAFGTLLAVDVVLGPALTLLVARPDKPKRELFTDLSLIGLFQVAAFSYGSYILYSERPLFMVVSGRFESKNIAFLKNADITMERFANFPGKAPYYVALRPVETDEERVQYMENMMSSQPTASTKIYAPFKEHFALTKRANGLDLEKVWNDFPGFQEPMQAAISRHQGTDLVWFGYKGAMSNGVIAFNEQGDFVTFVHTDQAPIAMNRPEKNAEAAEAAEETAPMEEAAPTESAAPAEETKGAN
ncbi:hypothetical protein [Acanthopleuribacter pedis]|uniref:Fimbrial assembly protein n=1 Tax=Acanthopleuribacter pedis TaxID=442870 RepID=A0A8J7U253_9BACT|nr:hypothetical protein [Acanthopleuribacter pedis]MBO1316918.1 hypothetical protein [Acanthopleuribacter pedis]